MYKVHTVSTTSDNIDNDNIKDLKRMLMVSSTSVEEWDPETDGWLAREDQRMPTAMHGFPTIPVKINDFCAQNYLQ